MEGKISILVRDCHGRRKTLEFESRHQVLAWAEDEDKLTEEDEILIITQGNICLYSGLMSDSMLTADDITGFFC